jgi:hypothetical protein
MKHWRVLIAFECKAPNPRQAMLKSIKVSKFLEQHKAELGIENPEDKEVARIFKE